MAKETMYLKLLRLAYEWEENHLPGVKTSDLDTTCFCYHSKHYVAYFAAEADHFFETIEIIKRKKISLGKFQFGLIAF